MTEEAARQLRSRIRRLIGQANGLEATLEAGDANRLITQLEAVIGASKAALSFFADNELLQRESLSVSERKLLTRLIRKT